MDKEEKKNRQYPTNTHTHTDTDTHTKKTFNIIILAIKRFNGRAIA
jgi:hypothetical protein